MSDLISRQAVIDHINKLIEVEKKQGTDDWGYGRERVNAYEAMIHFVENKYLYPSIEPEKCGDCVSRKCVNDLIDKWTFKHFIEDGEYVGENPVTVNFINADILQKDINSLPSVEPDKFILQNLDRFGDNEDTRDTGDKQ